MRAKVFKFAFALLFVPAVVLAQSVNIPQNEQWTSTTSPSSAITQRTYGKGLKITGLTTGLCLTLDANNLLTTTACGSGSGDITGGTSLGTGVNIFDSESSGILRFNSISAGSNVTFSTSTNNNTIVISATGGGGSYPFTPQTIGGTEHSASSTRPFYFSQGLLTSTSTIGTLTAGTINATSTITLNGVGLVPYTGATTDVDLAGVGITFSDTGTSIYSEATNQFDFYGNAANNHASLNLASITTDRTYTFPDASGTLCLTSTCTGTYPFTPRIIGGSTYQATSSTMYFGLLSGSSTIGKLTATSSADFLAGLTINCTSCVTDANVADLAVGGDVTGTLSSIAVTNDSHDHTGTTLSGIDISADTNLTAGDGLTFTDDDIDCDTASSGTFGCLSTTDWTTFNNKQATISVAYPVTLSGATVGFAWAYPFNYQAIGGTLHAASTTVPFYLSHGLLTASTTVGVGAFGSLTATSSVSFPSGSITNTMLQNSTISGIALGSNLADLTAGDSTLTLSGSYNGGAARTIVANCVAITGSAGLCDGDDATGAGAANPFTWLTNFGTTSAATSSSIWLQGGLIFASSTGTSTFMGGISAKGLSASNGLNVTGKGFFTSDIIINNNAGFRGKDTNGTVVNLLTANDANDAHFLANVGNGNALDSAFGGFNSDVAFSFGGECCGGAKPTSFSFDTSGNVTFTTPLVTISEGNDDGTLTLTDSDGSCSHNPESGSETVTCSSDEKFKENVRDAPSVLDKFNGLKIRKYTIKSSGDETTGVIAQEVQQTNPEMVKTIKSAEVKFIEIPGCTASGKDPLDCFTRDEITNEILGVEQPNPWELVKAIQEQQAQIDALEVEIAALQAKKVLGGMAENQSEGQSWFIRLLRYFTQ